MLNKNPGGLTEYDCPECLNRGHIYIADGPEICMKQCKCLQIRNSLRRLESSGLSNALKTHTFDSYKTPNGWQNGIKEQAQKYAVSDTTDWFFIGGQVGCGKTHLCTAIVGELLKRGNSARYMLWRDDAPRLKACVNDDVEYAKLINPLKTADVLYIDDLFKTGRDRDGGRTKPTAADINLAFEIINARYISPRLKTIISTELTVDEIVNVDEAVGSRIYQKTKHYCIVIQPDKTKNYRIYGDENV